MKKGILILGTILLCGFAPIENLIERDIMVMPVKSDIITQEIKEFNQIIEDKLEMADKLDVRSTLLLKEDQNSVEGHNLAQEAQMQRMMTLKYRAAIACRAKL